jgi:hypothetical protein
LGLNREGRGKGGKEVKGKKRQERKGKRRKKVRCLEKVRRR